jgi:glycosyltransferase involved in cell wall biosynthesis
MSPPTILFMGRIFEVPWGGVREMAESLLRAAAPLCAAQGRRIDVLVPRAGMCPVLHEAVREVVLPRFGGNRILWDHWTVANHANRQPNAVLYNIKLVLPERLRIPGFTSIHDLMYFPQPTKYDWREYLLADSLYMRLMVTRTVRRARYIHTDSHHTAADARDLFPTAPPDMFRTIHLGVDAARLAPRPEDDADRREWEALGQRGVEGPYILYTGGLSRRKNITLLLRAARGFLERHPEYRIVVTGGSKPTIGDPALADAIAALPAGKLIRLGAVSSRALKLLYQRAQFFVFPSLYEGFGLPPLEAQAAGCPVICSRATSLPEVVGDSALLIDPHSEEEMAAALEAMTDEATRALYRQRGLENSARFTWERTAAAWLDLVDDVYRDHRP